MIRWFAYGFALTLGAYTACALTEKIDRLRRDPEEEPLFVG